jgi:hypothetical protein
MKMIRLDKLTNEDAHTIKIKVHDLEDDTTHIIDLYDVILEYKLFSNRNIHYIRYCYNPKDMEKNIENNNKNCGFMNKYYFKAFYCEGNTNGMISSSNLTFEIVLLNNWCRVFYFETSLIIGNTEITYDQLKNMAVIARMSDESDLAVISTDNENKSMVIYHKALDNASKMWVSNQSQTYTIVSEDNVSIGFDISDIKIDDEITLKQKNKIGHKFTAGAFELTAFGSY